MINRRDALLGTAGAATGLVGGMTLPMAAASAVTGSAATGGAAGGGGAAGAPANSGTRPPDLGFLQSEPLVNADRLRYFLRQAGLDAIVVAKPANVMYLTNFWPQLDLMGSTGTAIAVFSADPRRPVSVIMQAFIYYYVHAPESGSIDRALYLYTEPLDPKAAVADGAEPPAGPGRTLHVSDPSRMSARDLQRAAALKHAGPMSADVTWALAKALRDLGLDKARLGIDDPDLKETLDARQFAGEVRPAENLMRRTRFVKSEREIHLMRLAAQNNVAAAMATARRARELGSTRLLRAQFFAEAARRGNAGVFMVVNSTSSEMLDEPLVDGSAFSIDCVSTCHFYHGDFARTVFVGEPLPRVRRATTAIATAWHEIGSQLKAGMTFADVTRIGRESLKSQGVELNVSFGPHSVGLFHTDHPQPSWLTPHTPEMLVLEENMILSVDCPVLESGLGGTMHLEDLMLIRKDGAEPIHEVPPGVIVV
jgi:Xaa-Pro aminopeptidase